MTKPNDFHFMRHPGNRADKQPIVLAFESQKDRDDMVRALTLSGHGDHGPVTRDEAFALVEPDRDGKRRFGIAGGVDYVRLPADWQPGQAWLDAQPRHE